MKKEKNYEKLLNALDNTKLLDIIKNFHRYGYPEKVVEIAKSIINSRDISPKKVQEYQETQQSVENGKRRYYQKLKDTYFECQIKWWQLNGSLFLMFVSLGLLFVEFWFLVVLIASVLFYFVFMLQFISRVADLKQSLSKIKGKPEAETDHFVQFILLVTFLGIYIVTASRYFILRSEIRLFLDQEGVSFNSNN